ncbi:MAG: hypothetical protein MUF87_22035 [Anaerolineae bacterium]|jgi:hypothetical protein|nr:hypothetical protein [Anaerolineae bacterium]
MVLFTALAGGILMSMVLTVLVLVSLAHNPRILIINGPEIMRETLAPLSEIEMRSLKRGQALTLLTLFLMPLVISVWYESTYPPLILSEAFFLFWIMWMIFNIVDFVIIDWFILLWWQPSWFVIPNARPYREYTDYKHHFRGFLKGTVMLAVLALVYAVIVVLI